MYKSLFIMLLVLAVTKNEVFSQQFNPKFLYPIEASHSYMEFIATYMGYAKVKGSFSNFNGSIYFDESDWSRTSVSFLVEVESIDSNNDWRDRDLKSANWFEAETYPSIRFISTRAKKIGDQIQIRGNLTIKETTKEISLLLEAPIKIKDIRGDDQVIFVGNYELNRKEYGVMGKNWSQIKEGIAALADEITIEFSMLGKRINEENFKNWFRNSNSPRGSILLAYNESGIEAAIDQFEKLKTEKVELSPGALNMTAYMLIKQNKLEDALTLLLKNKKEFPEDANIYDSLGEVYALLDNMQEAKEHYEKSIALNANNMNAVEFLKHL